ncbi:uncharacterized protein Triagg1_9100 [Trichoderma aggressivum f. europaeum]|uniref:Uncharacterized protein n=1 Tax=Trichoderma aggressivum f. europaeum TaxID=173218 RepID=A0AAE1I8W5_9HYPO|nr:hypothetical protein Triagg1_9100 [Trichoderma aggressivum f. europaeum]
MDALMSRRDPFKLIPTSQSRQLQGLTCTSFIPPGPRDYEELYTKPQWELEVAGAVASLPTSRGDNVDDLELLNDKIDRSELPAMVWLFQRIFEWIDFLFPWIEAGARPTYHPKEYSPARLIFSSSQLWEGILRPLATTFESYTFTDISTGFFEVAAEAFAPWVDEMIFKRLNAEKDVIEQGYQEKTYGFIIASNVLYATKTLSETMQNVCRPLKSGGQLLLLEVTSEIVRVELMMAGLSGWRLGGDDGRRHGPTITRDQWDSLLKDTDFSGVDRVISDFVDEPKYMTSVMISQAVDSDVTLLRQPLLTSAWATTVGFVQGSFRQSIWQSFGWPLQRSIYQYPHVAVQHMNFDDDITDTSVSVIAGAVIRLIYAAQRKFNDEIIWTNEPELLIKDGKL